ncbi:hypothetical protein RI367_004876 [Sorochytrium milnesiophthora]
MTDKFVFHLLTGSELAAAQLGSLTSSDPSEAQLGSLASPDPSAAQQDAAVQSYSHPSLSTDGFVHCSSYTQCIPTANRYYAVKEDGSGDGRLFVLVIDTERLAAHNTAIKWESGAVPHSGGAVPSSVSAPVLFPHIYGAIPRAAIVAVLPVAKQSQQWSRIEGGEHYAS